MNLSICESLETALDPNYSKSCRAARRTRYASRMIMCLFSTFMLSGGGARAIFFFPPFFFEGGVPPLIFYLAETDEPAARAAVIDYGQAIKDLAATNIFPGDIFPKNFGVTRPGRVVFYDYDELCWVTDCDFRELPAPTSYEEEFAAEPWFSVHVNDIFPEEFPRFLGLRPDLLVILVDYHGDLFHAVAWRRVQTALRAGNFLDI